MEGLEVKGDNYNTQITSSLANLMLDSVGTTNTGETTISPLVIKSPIVAVRPSVGGRISDVYYSQQQGRYVINGSGTVYQFSTDAAKRNAGFGLEVYKSDGSVAYSSAKQLLKVVGSGSITLDNPVTLRYDYPVAVIFNSSLRAIYPGGGFTGRVTMSGVVGNADGSITLGRHVIDVISNFPADNPAIGNNKSDYLIVDVRNM